MMLANRSSLRSKPFAQAVAPQRISRPISRPILACVHSNPSLCSLLDDAASAGLGKVRFIVLGDGAILESVNNWGSVRYTDVPGRGLLATIASEDKSFECHITLSKVQEVRFAISKAKSGDYPMYATRFLGPEGRVLMSCLLHGSQGVYDPAAVAAWSALAAKYGEIVKF